jgi:hypothetical protein
MGKFPELPIKVEVGAKATLDIRAEIPRLQQAASLMR